MEPHGRKLKLHGGKMSPKIETYLKMVCIDLDIDWEDYKAQWEYEIPLAWALPPFVGFMYSDIFLAFLDLDLWLYRKISKDIDTIKTGKNVYWKLTFHEKIPLPFQN